MDKLYVLYRKHNNHQVDLNGNFLHEAYTSSRVPELVFFATIQMLFSHKRFDRNDTEKICEACGHSGRKYSYQQFNSLLRSCKKWGIIIDLDDKKGGHRLLSNAELQEKFGGKLEASAYIPYNILQRGINLATKIVKTIPAHSCIVAQKKKCAKIRNNTSKNDCMGSFVSDALNEGNKCLTIKEHQELMKAKKKGYDKVTHSDILTLSNKEGAKRCRMSETTFIQYKYLAMESGVFAEIKRRYEIYQECISDSVWRELKKDLAAYDIPTYAKYNPFKQQIYWDLACEFVLPKYA